MPRTEGHLSGRLSRLVVKDHLLCMCLWETLMFIYRGKNRSTSVSICLLNVSFPTASVILFSLFMADSSRGSSSSNDGQSGCLFIWVWVHLVFD